MSRCNNIVVEDMEDNPFFGGGQEDDSALQLLM